MSDVNLESLERKLDLLIKLTAYVATKGMTVAEAAPILNGFGMSPAEIAIIMRSTPNAVSVRLSEAKSANKKDNSRNE